MKNLVLVDGNSLLFRAYYATVYKKQILKNKEGVYINALLVFINMFKKILEKTKDNICVVFDSKEKTQKHVLYNEYKKKRLPTPNQLISQIELIKKYLKLSGIKYHSQSGYEADDIIGTLAKKASKDKISVLIFSSDRDFLQLIDNNITICLIKKGLKNVIYYNEDILWNELNLKSYQIIDFKSIVGDHSDNIPGIPRIGPKTAIKLLNKFDNLENIFNNLQNIDNKIREKLISFKERVFFNRLLVTIDILVPLCFDYTQTNFEKIDDFLLKNFLQKYKFFKK
ncbi:5'-3' exonuclease, C-terminal SAM fold family protein [Candidatus Phytoplasma oryzae]|uniref:5'-3' exonuclease n=1 Tax=Candidatus Phytoplasma oryzae TaxID=203274 RepID=A0A139JQQ0_9MOLU|nr:5'-3' exonuclease H3TH domain-containing protein [Candidatus Phytoplasma oryzae]KXT29196.1 5'-3' exonuclease, C-terminal SAM fold family protein [Candidatus Phytoplasma oryzae]KXT29212.1 5'-3' exonuclease, C-terminal SAM fold family protein [Candidatus Phytoplasma oryzae]